MRGLTIQTNIKDVKIRRSTKHIKIGRKCFSSYGMQKWNYLLKAIEEKNKNEKV